MRTRVSELNAEEIAQLAKHLDYGPVSTLIYTLLYVKLDKDWKEKILRLIHVKGTI